jgi:hypothetical protein
MKKLSLKIKKAAQLRILENMPEVSKRMRLCREVLGLKREH